MTKGIQGAEVFPSIRTLAEVTGWGNGRVYKALAELEAKRLLSKTSGRRKKGSRENAVNHYSLVDDFEYYRQPEDGPVASAETGVAAVETGGVTTAETDISYITCIEEEEVFKTKHFSITKKMVSDFRKAYPSIIDFYPEVLRVSNVLDEKEARGKPVGSPIAFLHTHLSKRNEELKRERQKQPLKGQAVPEFARRMPSNDEPEVLGEILAKVLPRVNVKQN